MDFGKTRLLPRINQRQKVGGEKLEFCPDIYSKREGSGVSVCNHILKLGNIKYIGG